MTKEIRFRRYLKGPKTIPATNTCLKSGQWHMSGKCRVRRDVDWVVCRISSDPEAIFPSHLYILKGISIIWHFDWQLTFQDLSQPTHEEKKLCYRSVLTTEYFVYENISEVLAPQGALWGPLHSIWWVNHPLRKKRTLIGYRPKWAPFDILYGYQFAVSCWA